MTELQGSCGQGRKCDVIVSVDLTATFVDVVIISKFDKMFGSHMEKVVRDVLREHNIKEAKVIIEDEGALDFVIRARLITALRRVGAIR